MSRKSASAWPVPILALLPGCVVREGAAPGMFFGGYGVLGLLILILDLIAIFRVAQSGESTLAKLVWIVVILAFPVLGLLIWLVMGPGRKR